MIWSLPSRFMSHSFSQLRNTFGSQKKTRNGFKWVIYTSSKSCCSAMHCNASPPKSSRSIQLRACFIRSPPTTIFLCESRAPGAHLCIRSEQTFPWWGNHSEGVGVEGGCQRKPKSYLESTLRTGNGVGCNSAMRPYWWQGEKEVKWQHQKERSVVLGPKITRNYWKFH